MVAVTATATANATLHIFCWHVHAYFMQTNQDSIGAALALHHDFLETFGDEISPLPCEAEVNEDDICLWGCQRNTTECLNMIPQGPHTFGSVGFSIPNSHYNHVVPWVFKAYALFGEDLAGVLIHPLTAEKGDDTLITRRRDHTLGMWIPNRLPIDYDFLDHNIYDCTACDAINCTQACRKQEIPHES
eukprot:g3206.t1